MPEFDEVVDQVPGRPATDALAPEAAVSASLSGGSAVLLTLGPLAFSPTTATFERLQRRTAFRWPVQARVGRRPAMQSTGRGEDAITLEGVVVPTYRGTTATVDDLVRLAVEGRPQLLTAGDGTVFGEWVVTSVESTREAMFEDGAPRRLAYTVSLAHYGTDTPEGRLDAVEAAARTADVRTVAEAVSTAAAMAAATPATVSAAAQEAAGATPTPGSKRVLDAVLAAAARGAQPSGIVDAALRTASRSSPGAARAVRTARIAYRAQDGDTLDDIARRRYGDPAAVATLLASNGGLAAAGPRLAAGTLVGLPDEADRPSPALRVPQLWD